MNSINNKRKMMNRDQHVAQVELLLDCLPALKEQEIFAWKGGTAINFFIRDLPRLSVDIDLTYVKSESRKNAIKAIESGLIVLGGEIIKRNKKIPNKRIKNERGSIA